MVTPYTIPPNKVPSSILGISCKCGLPNVHVRFRVIDKTGSKMLLYHVKKKECKSDSNNHVGPLETTKREEAKVQVKK
jgi:hypothetical protein